MNKITKTTFALAAVALLAGCSAQKQCDEKTAIERAAKIAVEAPKQKLGEEFSVEQSTSAEIDVKEGTTTTHRTSDASLAVVYDKNALFFYSGSLSKVTETGQDDSIDGYEGWTYYLDGYLYNAYSSTSGSKTVSEYTKTQMTLDAAKLAFVTVEASVKSIFESVVVGGDYLADIEDEIKQYNGSMKSDIEKEGGTYSSKLFLGSDDEQGLYFEGSCSGETSETVQSKVYRVKAEQSLMFEYKQNHFIRSKEHVKAEESVSTGDYANSDIEIEIKVAYSKLSKNYPDLSDWTER